MKKFITFEEKILKDISLHQYITYLNDKNVDGLKIALHETLLDLDNYKALAKECQKTSLKLSYHVPDFVIEGQYEIANIRTDASIKKNFIKLYDDILMLAQHAKIAPDTIITFHGAKAYDRDYDKAYDNTMFFSDFSLNLFEKRSLPFKLSCESLNTNIMTFGDSRIDLVKLVSQFESDKLGICWDIVHDSNNYDQEYMMPDDLFYKYINNVHIHGSKKVLSTIEDHIALHKSELNTKSYIDYLKEHNYNNALTHELLSFKCQDYRLDLDKDLDLLNTFF